MALTKVGKEGITGISNASSANAVTIDSNGNVGVGATSPAGPNGIALTVNATTNPRLRLTSDNTGTGTGDGSGVFLNNSDMYLSNEESAPMIFRTSASERMRIDSSGNILIGDTTVDKSALSSGSGLTFNSSGQIIAALSASNGHYINRTNYSSGTYNNMVFMIDGSTKGTISCNGSSTAYNTSSDYRLKENVVEMSDATTRLKQLKPCRFNFIADADTTVDGFLAHEVSHDADGNPLVPEAVTGTHNEVDDDGNLVMQGIDQSKLVPLLVKTIQELEARITALESA